MANEKRLIDANKMKNNIMEAMMRQFEKNGDQTALRIAEMMWHFIDKTDTVDAVEVVHGRWIVDESGVIICSECGAEHEWQDYRATFCEDCGAKMDGGNGDEKI